MLRKALLALGLLLFADLAHAATEAPLATRRKYGTGTVRKVISAVAANAAAADRTLTLNVAGYSRLTLQVDVTEGGTISAVVVTCSASLNGGATYAQLTSTTVSAGAGTVVPYADTYATDASANVLLEYDVSTYDYFKCVVDVTGGGATDAITAYATAAVGQ